MEKRYEIVWFGNELGSEDNTICSLEELKGLTIKLAQENNFELVKREEWIKFINHGELINEGYAFVSFKNELSDNLIEALCGQILAVLEIETYQIHDGFKTRIDFVAALPDTPEDNDQVLYQMGFVSTEVSKIAIYIENKHVANYGSDICGEQSVWCYFDEEDDEKFVEVGEGHDYRLHKNAEILLEAMALEKETGGSYLYYGNNCWLSPYFIDLDGDDLEDIDGHIEAQREFVHGSISEGLDISKEKIEAIIKALASQKEEVA